MTLMTRLRPSYIADRIADRLYQRAVGDACRPGYSVEELSKSPYHSQYGQDKFVVEQILDYRRDGVFVDIGAHDGATFSNTLFIEEQLGWAGIAVEPSRTTFESLQQRRECTVENICVSDREGMVPFLEIAGDVEADMLSGITDLYDDRHAERVKRTVAAHAAEATLREVPCVTLNSLARKHSLEHIDFLSIDTEGGELEILEAVDWNSLSISVICVENNYKSHSFMRLLRPRGYRLAALIGTDEIYAFKDHHAQGRVA